MKFYGYTNTKVNRLIGTDIGGEWVEVSPLRYIFLLLFGYMVKREKKKFEYRKVI